MNIDKDTILSYLHSIGQHVGRPRRRSNIGQVHINQHAGLLDKFRVHPADLIAKSTRAGGGRRRHFRDPRQGPLNTLLLHPRARGRRSHQ